MSIPFWIKGVGALIALKVVTGKKKQSTFSHSDVDKVIEAMPAAKQKAADDFVALIVWWETNPKLPRAAYGTMNGLPGWRTFGTKDELIQWLLDHDFIPTKDSLWNSSSVVPEYGKPIAQITMDLIGHALNTSALTFDDKYNLLAAMNWPHYDGDNNTIKVPASPFSPPGRPLDTEEKLKIAFTMWLGAYVEQERQIGGEQKYGDMGYVRFAARFNSTGAKIHVMSNGQHLHNPYTGDAVYKGTYADMVNYIGTSCYYQGFNTLSWSTIQVLIENYIRAMDAWGSLGRDGPTSTYLSSFLGSIDWGKTFEWAVKIYNWVMSQKSSDPNPETTDDVDPEILDISDVHP